jgi:hypothetical protein
MGCSFKLPFGAASLEHFLNASKVLLPNNRNVFIMTDDPNWVKRERKKYYSSRRHLLDKDTFKIFSPSVIKADHRGGSIGASAEFWGQITMAQQCQGIEKNR